MGFHKQMWPWLLEVELKDMLYHVDILRTIWSLTDQDDCDDVTQLVNSVIQDAKLANYWSQLQGPVPQSPTRTRVLKDHKAQNMPILDEIDPVAVSSKRDYSTYARMVHMGTLGKSGKHATKHP